MRVLLVNACHWLKGGVERTYLDESRWLQAAGHEVSHLAARSDRDLPSATRDLFAPPADFTEGGSALSQLALLPRALWSRPAARAMEQVLERARPDVAHLHAPSRHLTPSILGPLARAGVPVVMTLHDFKPWCTNRILFAHGEVCRRCLGGRHWRAAATGCVQGSRLKSAVGAMEAYLHDALHAYDTVRLWVCPSRFVHDEALRFGVPAGRLRVIAHGVEPVAAAGRAQSAPERYVLFLGRLSVEKGVRQLPAVARRIAPTPLLVAGDGPLAGWLRDQAVPGLRLLGHVEDAMLASLRAHASVVIAPSLFVEHFGYSVAESLLDARPVVASRIGALPELVEHERTGLLAEPGDAEGFAAQTARALEDPAAPAWGEAGRARVQQVGAPAAHLAALVRVYEESRRARA